MATGATGMFQTCLFEVNDDRADRVGDVGHGDYGGDMDDSEEGGGDCINGGVSGSLQMWQP